MSEEILEQTAEELEEEQQAVAEESSGEEILDEAKAKVKEDGDEEAEAEGGEGDGEEEQVHVDHQRARLQNRVEHERERGGREQHDERLRELLRDEVRHRRRAALRLARPHAVREIAAKVRPRRHHPQQPDGEHREARLDRQVVRPRQRAQRADRLGALVLDVLRQRADEFGVEEDEPEQRAGEEVEEHVGDVAAPVVRFALTTKDTDAYNKNLARRTLVRRTWGARAFERLADADVAHLGEADGLTADFGARREVERHQRRAARRVAEEEK